MGVKIVIIGAGSCAGICYAKNMFSFKALRDSTIALCDIDASKLKKVTAYLRRVIKAHAFPATIESDVDRTKLLPGADFVISTIAVGGPSYAGRTFGNDINIPRRYGIDQCVADTLGPGGVFRFLRTAPVQLEICRDMERYCPNAWLLNHTNPMAMLTWLHTVGSSANNIGLCHGIPCTIGAMKKYADLPSEGTTFRFAGINHQAWVLEFRHNGEDTYPLLRKAMEKPEIYDKDPVRFEIMKHFGYFCTEGTNHASEYLPYFRRNSDLRKRYHLQELEVKDQPVDYLSMEMQKDPGAEMRLGIENEPRIVNAMVTDTPFCFYGNVINTGLITNLPQGCCVEVPCVADKSGIHACHVGELPPQCAALNRSNIAVQELAVRAFLDRDREKAFQAVALDPLTAAVAPLDDIRKMFDEMWEANKTFLGYFAGA